MKLSLTLLAAGVCVAAFAGAAQAADVSVKRIECGTPQDPTPVNQRFSDTYSYGDLKLQFVYSCYLVKHDDQYLLWDTGHAMTTPKVAPKVSIVDQIAQAGVKPEQINFVGINSISNREVLDRFKKEKVSLSLESEYDPTKTKKVEVILKQLEAEHRHPFATVRTKVRNIPPPGHVEITFVVSEGRKD